MSAPGQKFRIFVAHPKHVDGRALDDVMDALRAQAAVEMKGADFEFVLGRDDFNANATRYGGWDGWTHSVVHGVEYRGTARRRRFDAVVVTPEREVGRATAQIVRHALDVGLPVLFFAPRESVFERATTVVQAVGGDFRSGWIVQAR